MPESGAASNDADIVLPDYGGAWIGDVLTALRAGRAPVGAPGWVAQVRQRVLVLIDGLGWEMYERFAGRLPSLGAFTGGPITSVVPSTTAAALPSLTTGLPPAEHGMLGDRMRVGGKLLSVLQWTVPDGRPPEPSDVQPHRPFGGGTVDVVSHAKFAGSGFSVAHLRGAPYHGYDSVEELIARVVALVEGGAPLVYAYFPDLDRTAHEHGMDHEAFAAALQLTDSVVTGIRRRLPATVAMLVTSDHGHVTTALDERVDLRSLQPLVSAMGGSTRLRYLHARKGASAELFAAAVELAGPRAWVHDRDSVVASGWLGPRMRPVVAGRLGDVVMAARGAATLVDPNDLRQARLITMHGSVTSSEMLVPLLAARGGG
jgi:hypothetical protein